MKICWHSIQTVQNPLRFDNFFVICKKDEFVYFFDENQVWILSFKSKWEKFVKLCYGSSKVQQTSLHFDGIFFKIFQMMFLPKNMFTCIFKTRVWPRWWLLATEEPQQNLESSKAERTEKRKSLEEIKEFGRGDEVFFFSTSLNTVNFTPREFSAEEKIRPDFTWASLSALHSQPWQCRRLSALPWFRNS